MADNGKGSALRGRVIVTVFLVGLAACSALLVYGLAPKLLAAKGDPSVEFPRWHCVEILTGDTVRIESPETTLVVRVRGIWSPPLVSDAVSEARARELGVEEGALLAQGKSARNTLAAWAYKRRLGVEFTPDQDGQTEGYVDVFGVDVGRRMLLGGQAVATDTPHPQLERYRAYEAEARGDRLGIWRLAASE